MMKVQPTQTDLNRYAKDADYYNKKFSEALSSMKTSNPLQQTQIYETLRVDLENFRCWKGEIDTATLNTKVDTNLGLDQPHLTLLTLGIRENKISILSMDIEEYNDISIDILTLSTTVKEVFNNRQANPTQPEMVQSLKKRATAIADKKHLNDGHKPKIQKLQKTLQSL